MQLLSVTWKSDHLSPAWLTAADNSGTSSCAYDRQWQHTQHQPSVGMHKDVAPCLCPAVRWDWCVTALSRLQAVWSIVAARILASISLHSTVLTGMVSCLIIAHLRQLSCLGVHCCTSVTIPSIIPAPVVDHLQQELQRTAHAHVLVTGDAPAALSTVRLCLGTRTAAAGPGTVFPYHARQLKVYKGKGPLFAHHICVGLVCKDVPVILVVQVFVAMVVEDGGVVGVLNKGLQHNTTQMEGCFQQAQQLPHQQMRIPMHTTRQVHVTI